ncbi:hypothetical protein ABZ934_27785 [Streptomyces sp. NPDC046557]|uniref:hypothetical protein n=1 Tax=Streptomyces sp. NPDC046557 TaxID=3155372 RepID=UPI003404D903
MFSLVPGLALTIGLVAGCGSSSTSVPPKRTSSTQPAPAESNPADDIPDNQAYVAYQPAQGGFTIKIPEGWSAPRAAMRSPSPTS